jgi:hypothetical protein
MLWNLPVAGETAARGASLSINPIDRTGFIAGTWLDWCPCGPTFPDGIERDLLHDEKTRQSNAMGMVPARRLRRNPRLPEADKVIYISLLNY